MTGGCRRHSQQQVAGGRMWKKVAGKRRQEVGGGRRGQKVDILREGFQKKTGKLSTFCG